MTLSDLWQLIKRKWVLVVVITLVCGAAGAGYAYLSKSSGYSATAKLYALQNADTVKLIADDIASTYSVNGCTITVGDKATVMDVTLSGAATAQDAVDTLNKAVQDMVTTTRRLQAGILGSNTTAGNATGQSVAEAAFDAKYATDASFTNSNGNITKFGVLGLTVGLVLSLCIVVLFDLMRSPIRSRRQVESCFEVPVLGSIGHDSPEKLAVNIYLASETEKLNDVCIVPLASRDLSENFSEILKSSETFKNSTARLRALDSFSDDISLVNEVKSAGYVVVVARQWKDSTFALDETLREIALSKAHLIGIVFD